MKEISYQVQGSASEPYNITISLNGSNLKCICNCPAGKNGMHCKHWMSVFEGKKQKYINLDESQIEEIQSSLEFLYSPNTTAPTESLSRFKAKPKTPPENSSIS